MMNDHTEIEQTDIKDDVEAMRAWKEKQLVNMNVVHKASHATALSQATNEGEPNFTDKIHLKFSNQSLSTATLIYQKWIERENSEEEQRKKLITKIMIALAVQLFVVTLLIVLNGTGVLGISDTVFIAFFGAIITECIGIIVVMVNYLYNERSTNALNVVSTLTKLVGENNTNYNKGAVAHDESEEI